MSDGKHYPGEVHRLCAHLALRIHLNNPGGREPTVTDRWLEICQAMIEKDGRTVGMIRAAIDWSQNNEFWRQEILGMGALRYRFVQLQQQAAGGKP
jgi:hypothetical protein